MRKSVRQDTARHNRYSNTPIINRVNTRLGRDAPMNDLYNGSFPDDGSKRWVCDGHSTSTGT
jgi:hypothetical protein